MGPARQDRAPFQRPWPPGEFVPPPKAVGQKTSGGTNHSKRHRQQTPAKKAAAPGVVKSFGAGPWLCNATLINSPQLTLLPPNREQFLIEKRAPGPLARVANQKS